MDKKYGTYTNEELNNWQNLPANSMVLTSSGFGAWLLRRDERKGNRDLITELEKLKAKISMTNGCGDFIATSDVETLIDTRIKELKGE